jgi:hypothetical protein
VGGQQFAGSLDAVHHAVRELAAPEIGAQRRRQLGPETVAALLMDPAIATMAKLRERGATKSSTPLRWVDAVSPSRPKCAWAEATGSRALCREISTRISPVVFSSAARMAATTRA